jgi:putative multiple sugar transport system substrate-binding protein
VNPIKTWQAAGLVLAAWLAVAPAQAQDKGTIGIAMPTKSSARWIADGENMVKVLKERGYKTDLQYADDDIPNQLAQVENMVTKGAKVLVIAAIDGTTLSNALQNAADKGVKVIAYDRLIRGSRNVDYYATFDNFQVGVLQATSIVDKLGLKAGKGPVQHRAVRRLADDNNAFFFYDGAMSVLKPYIDSGKLVVRSKQMGMDKVGTLRWDGAVAQARMDNLLSAFYGKDKLHAVLSRTTACRSASCPALKGVGYCTAQQPCPVVSGQDAESPVGQEHPQGRAVLHHLQGHARAGQGHGQHGGRRAHRQAARDQRHQDLQQRRQGGAVYLLKPVPVDASNWKKVLIDSGYYKEQQIK